VKPSPPFSGAGTFAARPQEESPTTKNNDKIRINVFLCIFNLLSLCMLMFFEQLPTVKFWYDSYEPYDLISAIFVPIIWEA
jgi:hypothetical protein